MRSKKLSVALAREALATRTEAAGGWVVGTPAGRTARRVFDGLVQIELLDRSMTLAAKIFTSVLPVIIALSTVSTWDVADQVIDDQFGIDPDALTSTVGNVNAASPSVAAFGLAGLLMVVIGGTSFARALARIYAKIWNVPSIGLRDAWRWLGVLTAVILSGPLIAAAHTLSTIRLVGTPLALAAEMAVWMAVWTLCPYLLTVGTLTGRVLWATGALTAVGFTLVRVGAGLFLPRITAAAQHQFGTLGLVFTTISWLFVLSAVIIGAAVIVKALTLDEAHLGRYLRGPFTPEATT